MLYLDMTLFCPCAIKPNVLSFANWEILFFPTYNISSFYYIILSRYYILQWMDKHQNDTSILQITQFK